MDPEVEEGYVNFLQDQGKGRVYVSVEISSINTMWWSYSCNKYLSIYFNEVQNVNKSKINTLQSTAQWQ